MILIGIGVVGLPQISVRAMSYKNSKAMHQALIIGTVVVGTIMIGMHLTGVFARVVLPGITVPDKVMPLLAMEVLPLVSWSFLSCTDGSDYVYSKLFIITCKLVNY